MNQNHDHYYKIQGLLHLTQREYCVYVINTPYDMKKIRVEKNNVFWEKKMEQQFVRFYLDCLLPAIIDSRYLRKMTIRNPSYTMEAKKKSQKIKTESFIGDVKTNNKRKLKQTKETENNKKSKFINDSKNLDDKDIQFIAVIENDDLTERDMSSIKRYFDTREFVIEEIINNVMPDNELNDEDLDCFMRILHRQYNSFAVESVQYIMRPNITNAVTGPAIQIIGGNYTGHWRVLYYDCDKLYVYDSISSFGKLRTQEIKYVEHRFPEINEENIIYKKMKTQQPDGKSCGLYAAAFALSIAQGEDPSQIFFTRNTNRMRQHFINIIQTSILLPFPTME